MHTSTYSSSSPIRTLSSGARSPYYQDQSSNNNHYNSYHTMNDNTISSRRVNIAYTNSASPATFMPTRSTTPSNRQTTNYNVTSNDPNASKYPLTSYRPYANGENDIYRSNNATSNGRAHSYDDLVNDQNQVYRSQSSLYNSTSRTGINHNTSYGSQRIHRDVYDDDLIVKSTDLSAAYEQEMVELVRLAFQKYDISSQRELAGFLKRSADKAFSACWHCIVGKQFSSYVTHEMNGFIYLTKGPLSILLFKSGS